VGEQVSDDKADYVTYTFNSLTDLEYAPRFETSKKLSSGEVSLGEDAGVQFEVRIFQKASPKLLILLRESLNHFTYAVPRYLYLSHYFQSVSSQLSD